jgi:histone acetyltransferase (RNA polymerase elongator complex component)
VKTALNTSRIKTCSTERFAPPPLAGGKPEKPLIIPIFIMNSGCPQRCVFCNQKIAAGNFSRNITQNYFDAEVASYLRWNKNKTRNVEIAFYGGSFTGLSQDDQKSLLDMAFVYIQKGQVSSIRISTRPDYVDNEQLVFLYSRGVRTIEIGAQSLNDEVLSYAGRGHDSQVTEKAMNLLKAHGFQTGLHLMAGLPHDTRESFLETLARVAELKPDTVRVHPVIVLKDTELADEFHAGRYRPLSLDEAVDWCHLAWEILTPEGIRIIRFGLQLTPEMNREGSVLAGPIHPSFGSLVYSAIFYSATMKLLHNVPEHSGKWHFQVANRDAANFCGSGNKNIESIKKLYPNTQIVINLSKETLPGHISLSIETGESFSLDIPGII